MEDQEVPYPWEAHFNEQYQTVFYFNTETGESSWEFPSESVDDPTQQESFETEEQGEERDYDVNDEEEEEVEDEYIRRALGEYDVEEDQDDDDENQQDVDDSGEYEAVQQDDIVDHRGSVAFSVPISPNRSSKSLIPQRARAPAPSRPGMSVVERSNLMLQKKREKEHAIRAEREQRELQEIHDPLINKSSKSINRSVEHMLSWDEHRKQKLQERTISRQFEQEKGITGRPAITKKAVEVGIRRQQEDLRLQNQLLFGEGDAADGYDDLGSVVSASQNTYVSGSTSVTSSRPVEDRLLEYEERKRLKLQRAVEQRDRDIRAAAAAPHVKQFADAASVGREGDVVERLYYGGGGGGRGVDAPSRAMQHDELTGQKLFQPRLNPTSAALANRSRPAEVPVEVLLNHKGEVYKQKLLEKGKRMETKAKMIREAPKINNVSAKLAERRQSVEGSTLAKPIGNLKPRTVKALPEHSFKPQISKGSQDIINASNIHYQVTSESVYNNHADRVERNPRFSGYDYSDLSQLQQEYEEGGRRYGRSDPYYDERMVYGELDEGAAAPPPPPEYYYEGDDVDDDYSRAYDEEEEEYRSQGRRAAGGGGAVGSSSGSRSGATSFGVLYDPTDSLMPGGGRQAAAPKQPFNRNNRSQSMYDRTVQWEKERVERMKREKASQERDEMKKCSFKPAVKATASSVGASGGANNSSFYDSGGNGTASTSGSIADRQNEWARKREQKLEAERLRTKDDELKDCSFAPQRSTVKGNSSSRSNANNRSYDSSKINASLDSIAAAVANIGTGLGSSGTNNSSFTTSTTAAMGGGRSHVEDEYEDDGRLFDYGEPVLPGRVPIPLKSAGVPLTATAAPSASRVPVSAYSNYVDDTQYRTNSGSGAVGGRYNNYNDREGVDEDGYGVAPVGRVPIPVKTNITHSASSASIGSSSTVGGGAKGRVSQHSPRSQQHRVDFSVSTKGAPPPVASDYDRHYRNDYRGGDDGITLDQQLFVEAAMDQYVDDFEREEEEFAREYASLSGGRGRVAVPAPAVGPSVQTGYSSYRSRGNYDLREPED